MIRLITLDLDNTLWDVNPVLIRAEKVLFNWIQHNLPQALPFYTRDNIYNIRNRLVAQRPDLAKLPTTLRTRVLTECFSQAGLQGDELADYVNQAFTAFHDARNEITFFPETIPLLSELQKSFSLIALSNGNADVHKVGLGQYFQAHFSAESTGKPKPHPAMYEAALEHAQVDPHQAIHVGDHPEEDINAAQKLGFRTIWFNQAGKNRPKTCHPDREVSQLNQLVSAINSLLD